MKMKTSFLRGVPSLGNMEWRRNGSEGEDGMQIEWVRDGSEM